MTEKKTEKKAEKDMTKDEYFDLKKKEVKQNQISAATKGLAFVFGVWLVGHAVDFYLDPTGFLAIIIFLLRMISLPISFVLVMYFVWGPQDIFWASFPREGYTKAILIGNELKGFLGCPSGKAFTEEWDVVNEDHPDAVVKRETNSFWGMYIVWPWPFANIYYEKTEWQRWYPTTKIATIRREILREFTLLPYPYYIEIVDAEDANRLGVTLYTNVVMKIVNPKKALFKQATTWIDIVRPIIQGGYVSYIKNTTFQDMIGKKGAKKDIGKELLEEMENPTDEGVNSPKTLNEMLQKVYGIKIESISVLDIIGSDEDEQKAIKAKAIAQLNREAILINADASSQEFTEKTLKYAFRSIAQVRAEKKSSEEEQQIANDLAENSLRTMYRDNPEDFKNKYGEEFKACLDFAQRKLAADSKSLIDIRNPDSKEGDGDLFAKIAGLNMILQQTNKGSNKTADNQQSDDGGDGKKKRFTAKRNTM
jgi:hypothetical protein